MKDKKGLGRKGLGLRQTLNPKKVLLHDTQKRENAKSMIKNNYEEWSALDLGHG